MTRMSPKLDTLCIFARSTRAYTRKNSTTRNSRVIQVLQKFSLCKKIFGQKKIFFSGTRDPKIFPSTALKFPCKNTHNGTLVDLNGPGTKKLIFFGASS
jgi:hypothetical protein